PAETSEVARPVVAPSSAPRDPDAPVRATPLARRLARDAALDLKSIPGTGRRNRPDRTDAEAALAGRAGPRPARPSGGAGTVLRIHGFAGDGRAWLRLASLLQRDGLAVATPDLPGHGTNTASATDLPALVADMKRYAAGLPGELHIVGHSLGAA